MNRQTSIDKVNFILEKKLKNQLRLAEIQARRKVGIKTTVASTTPAATTSTVKPVYTALSNTNTTYSA